MSQGSSKRSTLFPTLGFIAALSILIYIVYFLVRLFQNPNYRQVAATMLIGVLALIAQAIYQYINIVLIISSRPDPEKAIDVIEQVHNNLMSQLRDRLLPPAFVAKLASVSRRILLGIQRAMQPLIKPLLYVSIGFFLASLFFYSRAHYQLQLRFFEQADGRRIALVNTAGRVIIDSKGFHDDRSYPSQQGKLDIDDAPTGLMNGPVHVEAHVVGHRPVDGDFVGVPREWKDLLFKQRDFEFDLLKYPPTLQVNVVLPNGTPHTGPGNVTISCLPTGSQVVPIRTAVPEDTLAKSSCEIGGTVMLTPQVYGFGVEPTETSIPESGVIQVNLQPIPHQQLTMTAAAAEWRVGEYAQQEFTIHGGTSPFTWALTGAGASGLILPSGDSATDTVSGSPTVPGNFTVHATDGLGIPGSKTVAIAPGRIDRPVIIEVSPEHPILYAHQPGSVQHWRISGGKEHYYVKAWTLENQANWPTIDIQIKDKHFIEIAIPPTHPGEIKGTFVVCDASPTENCSRSTPFNLEIKTKTQITRVQMRSVDRLRTESPKLRY